MQSQEELDPRIMHWLSAYAEGLFPMADENNQLHWYSAHAPAIVPLDERFHIPRSMRRVLNQGQFHPKLNCNFEAVMQGCANRTETWISEELKEIYRHLHMAGYAYSFETWQDGVLAGGVLGIVLGGVFIGESMFTTIENGGKAALIYLVQALRLGGFKHFDCQLINENTARFGAYEVRPEEHRQLLHTALLCPANLRRGIRDLTKTIPKASPAKK